MRRTTIVIVLALSLSSATYGAEPFVMGDYNSELRSGGHVDIPLMIQRLKDLNANTYMWLIWHSEHDWDDLHQFLPEAKKAGIDVWVYLVPHTETPAFNPQFPYSEPFKLDYVRWAREIARLANKHENLVGYVIDDFGYNLKPEWFSKDYITKMVAAGKRICPRLRFYPLVYYRELNADFVEQLAPLVDGFVAAYPSGPEQIRAALKYLNDQHNQAGSIVVRYPSATPSRIGDFGSVRQRVKVADADQAALIFSFGDSFHGPTAGYHMLQCRIDGRVVWEHDCAGEHDGQVEIKLTEFIKGKRQINLAFGVWDRKGVSQFPLRAWFSIEKVTGLDLPTTDLGNPAWRARKRGRFTINRHKQRDGESRWRKPLIVMPAGSRSAFAKRRNKEATPKNIADHVAMIVALAKRGEIEGVVTYCLDKTPGNTDLDAVARVYAEAATHDAR